MLQQKVQPYRWSRRINAKDNATAAKNLEEEIQCFLDVGILSIVRFEDVDGHYTCADTYLSPERLQLVRDSVMRKYKKKEINIRDVPQMFRYYLTIQSEAQKREDGTWTGSDGDDDGDDVFGIRT